MNHMLYVGGLAVRKAKVKTIPQAPQ